MSITKGRRGRRNKPSSETSEMCRAKQDNARLMQKWPKSAMNRTKDWSFATSVDRGMSTRRNDGPSSFPFVPRPSADEPSQPGFFLVSEVFIVFSGVILLRCCRLDDLKEVLSRRIVLSLISVPAWISRF